MDIIHSMKKLRQLSLQKYEDTLLLVFGLILALVLRLLLRGYISGDAVTGSLGWYEIIERHNGAEVLAHNFSGYTPLYLYMLVLSYYLNQVIHVHPIFAIKLSSIAFDFFAAFWVYKIVQLKYPGRTVASIAALAFLFVPTVFMNGAMWGQIDGMFTAFMLASFYYLLKQRDVPAMIYFGLGFSIKFQVVFLAPFLLLLLLLGRLSFRSLFIIPAVYLATCVPAWLIGRNLGELIMLYPNQVDSFDQLSLNAPTFYALIDNSVNYLFNNAGIIVAGMLVSLAVYGVYKLHPQLTPDVMVTLASVCLVLIVYLLPKMHERYFFPAEVFFVLAAFYRPRLTWVVVALQVTALSTYSSYFFGSTFLPLNYASLINLVVLVYIMMDAGRLVMANRSQSANPSGEKIIQA